MLKCCLAFLSARKHTLGKHYSAMSFSALGHEFKVNESAVNIKKRCLLMETHTKQGYVLIY